MQCLLPYEHQKTNRKGTSYMNTQLSHLRVTLQATSSTTHQDNKVRKNYPSGSKY